MKVGIIIPARYESSRFQGKPLANILGKTLIQRVHSRCSLFLETEHIYIATDDSRIYNHCLEHNMKVILTGECLTGTDRVYRASLFLQDYDVVINVQGDEPLINPDDIKLVLDSFTKEPDKIHCGMCDIETEEDFRSTSVPKVVCNENNYLMYMSRAAIPTTKKLEFIKAKRQVCIYAFPKQALKDFGLCKEKSELERMEDIEILRFFSLGYEIKMVDVSKGSVAVDYPEDVERVEKILRETE